MKQIRFLTVAALAVLAVTAFAGGKKGSCYSKAKSLGSSQTATLVPEWDTEEKEEWDNGVAYYKMELKRGQAYTVWITGGDARSIELDAFTNDEYYEDRDNEPMASFDVDEIDGGAIKYAYLLADDWDEEDPSKGHYIVELDGEIGQSTQLNFTKGIKAFTKVGTEDSPKSLSIKTSWKNYSARMVDGEYYISVSLKAGNKYRFYVRGGQKGSPIGFTVDGATDSIESPSVAPDPEYSTAYNDAYVVIPQTTGKHLIVLDGDTSQLFKFTYRMIPTRAIGSHVSIPLLPENNYTSKFVPGRVADNLNYYDAIIDEHLARIYLQKGETWSFETFGATEGIEMVAYDTKGRVLARNESADGIGHDTRIVVTASSSGVYYVGVCDPVLDADMPPTGPSVTLTATNVETLNPPDDWDPADDSYAGATFLTPCPASSNQTVDASVFASGPHRLAANDLYDVFAVPCRKGYTYELKANFAEESEYTNLFSLASKAFYRISGKEKTVTTTGSVTPYRVDRESPLTFTSPISGIVYVRIWIAEGKGLEYPGYDLTARVSKGDTPLGLVRFDAIGAAGTCSINAETAKYPSGSVIAVATNENLKVVFNAITGFTPTPASTNVAVTAFADGMEPVRVSATYADVYDGKYVMGTKTTTNKKTGKKTTTTIYSPADGDATPAGAFAITPAYTSASAKRTLQVADPADWFSFTAATNVYYNLKLDDPSGGTVMTVSNALEGVVFTGDELVKSLLPTGKTYVAVTHAAEPATDVSYALAYSRAAGGTIKFSATGFSVKEGSEYASLTVSRSGSEGAVRVKYFTEAGTALPGTNYWPVTEGEVSWKNGDKANKTIKVKLIPDLHAAWAASNLFFNVKLAPVDEYGLAADEYLARIVRDTAKVTITEATSKTPGKIALAAFTQGDGPEQAVSNTGKPAVAVRVFPDDPQASKAAGGVTNTLVFTRSGGTSGAVSVTVKSSPLKTDTAKVGSDYAAFSAKLTWADGDAEPKTVPFVTYSRGFSDLTASRKFNVAIAAVKGSFTPTLAAKTATVTVGNGGIATTGAAYAKTIPASSGVKLATKGTWVIGADVPVLGATANGVSLTYTLTGPGLFACSPFIDQGEGGTGRFTCKVNKASAVAVTNWAEEVVRLVGSGTTTIVFTLSGLAENAFGGFEPYSDGTYHRFVQFKDTVPVAPLNKAVVTEAPTLSWSVPEALAAEPKLFTRVRFGLTTKAMSPISYQAADVMTCALPSAPAAGKTGYWTVDYALAETESPTPEELAALKWTNGPSTWSFTMLAAGAAYSAVIGGTDAAGNDMSALVADGEPIELIQCVKPDGFQLGGGNESGREANMFRLVAGSLPKGLSIDAASGSLKGCPTAVGVTTALLQSYNKVAHKTTKTVNGKKKTVTTYTYEYGTTVPVTFEVLPAGTALGSWCGAVVESDGVFPTDARHAGLITVSATSAGKITAKVTICGVAYTFSGTTGYDEMLSRDAESPAGDLRRLRVELKNTTTVAKKKYTNYLTLEIDDAPVTNSIALATVRATVELAMQVANSKKTAVTADVAYAGELVRSNGSTDLGKAALAPFAGYYTAGLAPLGVSAADGVPAGNGYLTFTVAESGSVKVSGVLADGSSVSFSSIGTVVGEDLADPDGCALLIPVCVAKSSFALFGNVRIAYETPESEVAVVIPSETLSWTRSASSAASRDGTGFVIDLAPTGGWYDKTENLQAHYLEKSFSVSTVDDPGDLPIEALASGYSFVTSSAAVQEFLAAPENLGFRFVGNTAKIDATKLVKNKTTGLYDFTTSVNPWSCTVKFTRATGIMTGTFSAWEWLFKSDDIQDFAWKQKEIKKLTHKGVWLYSRDSSSDSPLREDAATAGFFLMPATKSWKASLPFCVIESPADPDWSEVETEDE